MNLNALAELLAAHKRGELRTSEAAKLIRDLQYEDIGFARIDHARNARQGFPEVVFGKGKSRQQIVAIVERLLRHSQNVLVTHTDADTFGEIRNVATDAEWHVDQRLNLSISSSAARKRS